MTTVLKWAYRYHQLGVDEFDSVEKAVAAAHYASEEGAEALQCLEVVDEESHHLIAEDEVWKLAKPIAAAEQATWAKQESPRLVIEIVGPDGKTATEWWSNDSAATQERLAWWRGVVGADRVSLVSGDSQSGGILT